MRARARLIWTTWPAPALFALLAGAPALAAAEDAPPPAPEAGAARNSVASGAFLPWTMGARSDAQRALVYGQGGYDSAEKGPVFQTVLEAQVLGRLSLRAGGAYVGPSGRFRPEAGLRVDALRQEHHGIDLAVLGVYEAQGFNTVRAVTARLALSRTLGATRIVGNLGYGFGLQDSERYGDFRLAGLRAVTRSLQVGLDSRLRIDLERNADEPAGEPEWEILAGPLVTYAFDRYVISAGGGLSALKYRLVDARHVGAIGNVGIGAVF